MEPSFSIKYSVCLFTVSILLQANASNCCLEKEKIALLQLKSYFTSLSTLAAGVLSSWNGSGNCCLWKGVACNGNIQPHVIKLSLHGLFYNPGETHSLNLSLFQPFDELLRLDLSSNGIQRLVNIEELAHLEELRVLDLSFNDLNGPLSDQGLCSLRKLEELRLNQNELSGNLPTCLWNLTSLRVVDLSENSFSGNFPPIINLPSLKLLSIYENNLQGRFFLGKNNSKLEVLMLSGNALQVEVEESSCSSTFKLKGLGLSRCNVNGGYKTFPKFLYCQSDLKYIYLDSNGLFGSFPAWLLQNNSDLISLNLRDNALDGSLMLPANRSLSLSILDVSANKLRGKIPEDFGRVFPSLIALNMSLNTFEGPFPASIGNVTRITDLDLSDNLFDQLPRQLYSDCINLNILLLSENNFDGEMFPSDMYLPALVSIHLDGNNYNYVGNMKNSLQISTSLMDLDISNNKANGSLPSWIGDFGELATLSLAGNEFDGDIPSELCNLKNLQFLDLSENRFTGKIPSCDSLKYLQFFHVHDNHLTGEIPKGLAGSSSLITLDFRNNHLTGDIPKWIDSLSNLVILILAGNQLQGRLPIQLCNLLNLNIVDLSNNNISGVIPSCLWRSSFGATKWSMYGWGIQFEYGIPNLPFFSDVVYASLSTRGDEVEFIVKSKYSSYKGDILFIMAELDLSNNKLTGEIPPQLGRLTLQQAMNLSHNHLSGSIPISFSELKSIESLDLSSNNLSGRIPLELVDLTFLGTFKVCYNNLSGPVPETRQFGTFDENNYKGNRFLCGSLLPTKCGIDHHKVPTGSNSSTYEGDEGFDMQVFLWSFGMSSVTVLISFFSVLSVNPYWRRAWFEFIDLKFLWWFNP